MEFHRLVRPVDKPFVSGEEQQQGLLPRADKDYLRMLETQSLSDICGDLSRLAKDIVAVQTQLKIIVPLIAATFVAVLGFG